MALIATRTWSSWVSYASSTCVRIQAAPAPRRGQLLGLIRIVDMCSHPGGSSASTRTITGSHTHRRHVFASRRLQRLDEDNYWVSYASSTCVRIQAAPAPRRGQLLGLIRIVDMCSHPGGSSASTRTITGSHTHRRHVFASRRLQRLDEDNYWVSYASSTCVRIQCSTSVARQSR